MKSKQIVILVIALVALGVLGYFTKQTLDSEGKSDNTELISFEVENVEEVDKIVIFDPFYNKEFTIIKKNGEWTDKDGNCVQDNPVTNILDAFRKISFKGYVNKNLRPTVNRLMASKAKKVDIYKNGEWIKTWYVGHGTPDHYGTYMLLENPDIKSDQPVIMEMEGLNGIIEPRFFIDPKQWACSDLFSYTPEEIQSVTLDNKKNPAQSYSIDLEKGDFVARTNDTLLENVNQQNLMSFLNAFENIHFNQKNYTMSEKQIDSLKNANPHYILSIENKNGKKETFKFYDYKDNSLSTPVETVFSVDYLWSFTRNGELVRIQFGGKFGIGLGPIFIGKEIFVDNYVNN